LDRIELPNRRGHRAFRHHSSRQGTEFPFGICVSDNPKEPTMKALTWHGKSDIRCETVPDPKIQGGRDAIIKVTACAICGSDLHLFDGVMPSMEKGDVLGHETMGEVVEVGPENKKLKIGDRVVVPFTISCGECFFCKKGFFSGCERSNPNHKMAEKLWGHSPAGLFGYSHMLGGYSGPGRISAGALRRRRSHQGAARPQ
jgi:threonine dehydrogenase-like Zn-dependent dehydrogenase